MGLPFGFEPLPTFPTDAWAYSITVTRNNSGAIVSYEVHDPVWAPDMGGYIGTEVNTDAGPTMALTTFHSPNAVVTPPRLLLSPWTECDSAWMDVGINVTGGVKRTITAVHTSGDPVTYYTDVEEPPPDAVSMILMGVNFEDDGSVHYDSLAGLTAAVNEAGRVSAGPLVDAVLADREGNGHDGYSFIPYVPLSASPGFVPSEEFLLALHKATYAWGLSWDGEGYNGTLAVSRINFSATGLYGGHMKLGEPELSDRARCLYWPVPEGVPLG